MTNLSVPDCGRYLPEPLTAAETSSPPVLSELRIAPSNGGPLRPWERVAARMINRALETVEETYTWIHTAPPPSTPTHYGSTPDRSVVPIRDLHPITVTTVAAYMTAVLVSSWKTK